MKKEEKKRTQGFTIIELLVVVAIIGLLSSVALVALAEARARARDAQRLADMRQLQNALELYRTTHGRYPVHPAPVWWGACPDENPGYNWYQGDNPNSGPDAWVPDLAPTFIATLPSEPKVPGGSRCYIYRNSSDGSDYMLLSHQTVESFTKDTNPQPRPRYMGEENDGSSTCPDPLPYQANFAIYTPGARCW